MLPRLAADLVVPMEVVPGHLVVAGRSTYGAESLGEVVRGAGSAEELRGMLGARAVQEEYAVRCRRLVADFSRFVEEQRGRERCQPVAV